jgi:voltage-gated potassium channel
MSRKRIFEIIEKAEEKDVFSAVYDYIMIIAIIASLIPLAFKTEMPIFSIIDKITVCLFIMDYFLRWLTADYKLSKGAVSFVKYPFTFMAIIDLISILPSLRILNSGFKALRLLRMMRALRTIRAFKAMRYSRNIEVIANVLHHSKASLLAVCLFAGGYILLSALIIFNVEPDSFETFFDAIYWATVSLTTVGYGDIYPVTTMGRVITMISSVFGIAIVALPAGIITAGYIEEINKTTKE